MGVTGQQKRALFLAWLPAALGVLVICTESTDYLSSAHTGSLLQQLSWWIGCCSHWNLVFVNHILRKTGHFVGYGTLGLLFYRAWRLSGQILLKSRARAVDVIFSLLCTLAVSSGDEFHQSFLPSRTGLPQDVLLDMAGAAIFMLAFHLWLLTRRRQLVAAG
jgi:VanZ family protein